jgi:hypothetical protein
MAPRIVMLLGRSVWLCDAGGWRREPFDGGGDLTNPAVARLAELLSCERREKTVVVFEPEGLAHQTVDCPRVGRSVFATLARVRSEHPVVASESLGWGIEHPEPVQGGGFSTLMHSELAPGLAHLHDACMHAGSPLPAAWSAFTAATAFPRAGAAAPGAKFTLFLLPGFVAVAICAKGRRSFRAWTGAMADRDWKALCTLIGDAEARPGPSMTEAGLRRGSIAVIAEGEPERCCPVWPEIRATGRLEAVAGMEALAASAGRIGARHPGNLVEGFPRPRQLDRCLVGTAVGCLAAATALGAGIPGQLRQLKAVEATGSARVAALHAHLSELRRNRREMEALRNEASSGPGPLKVGRRQALLGLAEAVPDALTVTSLTIDRDDRFEIEAMVVGADFDPEGTRMALARGGFKPEGPNGWRFNAASGRISVSGRYATPQP